MIDFSKTTITLDEMKTIGKIANKAVKIASEFNIHLNHMTVNMDLELVHASIPLRLTELLEANTNEFMHDIGGIIRNMNRETGKLENCFTPRFAK